MRTRSKAESQPYQWTTIPVLAKIFKLIINELSNDIEAVAANQDTDVSMIKFFHVSSTILLLVRCLESISLFFARRNRTTKTTKMTVKMPI